MSTTPLARNTPPKSAWVTYAVLLTFALFLTTLVVLPLWKPLLLAVVLAGTLHGVHRWLSRKLGGRPHLSAGLVTVGVVVLLLIPISVIAYVAVREAIEGATWLREALKTGGLEGLIERLPDRMESLARRGAEAFPQKLEQLPNQLAKSGLSAASVVGGVLGAASKIIFELVMMLIAFFFLLTDGHRLVAWIEYASPLRDGQTRELFDEFRHTARSILTSLIATALVQGAAATGGYYIARVPQALFFGVLTFFAAFIPSVGTAVVALPLAGLLLLMGHKWAALFLAAWAIIVVGLVDNIVKPILISRGGGVHLHGVIVFFSLVGGIAIFGAIGLIAGPLVATFLTAVVRLGKRDFHAHPQPA